jgi:tRNA(Arg) A34 adenosine deaminase TadA
MYLFDRALYPDLLLKKSTLDMAYTNHVTESRRLKQYGLGFRMKYDLDSNKIIYQKTEIVGGILEEECANLMKQFFASKRN